MDAMAGFMLRRIIAAIPVMGFVVLFVFLVLRLAPGDPAAIIAGDAASAENIAGIREALGLNRSIPAQFAIWIGHVLQGDFGTSILSGVPVIRAIGERVAPSIGLAVMATAFAVVVAIPLGIIAAWKRGTGTDRSIATLATVGFSIPVFVIGYGLMLIFAVDLRWLPVQGYRSLGEGLGPFLIHQILPIVTLALPFIAIIARMTRASMLEVLDRDFIRTARAKGLGEFRVLTRHGLRAAAMPIIAVIGNGFALLIGGVVVTETVFNLPGIGRLTVDSVLARDYPVIQGLVLLTSAFYVALNLTIDMLYVIVDPRIACE
jgi:peptide/nickel transport system permease protein